MTTIEVKLMSHTPSPWTAGRDPCHYDTLSSVTGGKGLLVVEIGGGARPAEQEANTRLIAAAPELLAALESCVDELEAEVKAKYADTLPAGYPTIRRAYDSDMETVIVARAAIAKATVK